MSKGGIAPRKPRPAFAQADDAAKLQSADRAASAAGGVVPLWPRWQLRSNGWPPTGTDITNVQAVPGKMLTDDRNRQCAGGWRHRSRNGVIGDALGQRCLHIHRVDITRAFKAAKKAGVDVRVEIDLERKGMTITPVKTCEASGRIDQGAMTRGNERDNVQ